MSTMMPVLHIVRAIRAGPIARHSGRSGFHPEWEALRLRTHGPDAPVEDLTQVAAEEPARIKMHRCPAIRERCQIRGRWLQEAVSSCSIYINCNPTVAPPERLSCRMGLPGWKALQKRYALGPSSYACLRQCADRTGCAGSRWAPLGICVHGRSCPCGLKPSMCRPVRSTSVNLRFRVRLAIPCQFAGEMRGSNCSNM